MAWPRMGRMNAGLMLRETQTLEMHVGESDVQRGTRWKWTEMAVFGLAQFADDFLFVFVAAF